MSPLWEAKGATRREFIKGAAAVGAAIAALPLLSNEASASTVPPASGPGGMNSWQQSMPIYSGSVNLATGNGQLILPICGWGGLGGGLQFSLVFNSQSTRYSPVGPKWTHSYRWMVSAGTGQATVISDDGTETIYALINGVYVPPVGCYDALTQNSNGTWTLVRKGGVTYTFSSLGLVSGIVDIAGNTTLIYYNGNNIATIVDPAGRALNLTYSNQILNKITDCVGRVWYFSWNSNYDTQVIYDPPLNGDTNLRSRVIGYDANYNVNTLTNRLGQTWYYTYSASNVLQAAYDPSYRSWGLTYSVPVAGINWPATATLQANWTNSRGKITKYAFDALGQTVVANDATNRLTTFAWDSHRNRTDQWTPSGAHMQWGYDGRGNLNSITDPFGNQTIQTYD